MTEELSQSEEMSTQFEDSAMSSDVSFRIAPQIEWPIDPVGPDHRSDLTRLLLPLNPHLSNADLFASEPRPTSGPSAEAEELLDLSGQTPDSRALFEYVRAKHMADCLEADLKNGRVAVFPEYGAPDLERVILQHYLVRGNRANIRFIQQLKARCDQNYQKAMAQHEATCKHVENHMSHEAEMLKDKYRNVLGMWAEQRGDYSSLAQPAESGMTRFGSGETADQMTMVSDSTEDTTSS